MICSHCNLEVEKYENKSKKICKSCYQRMMNAHSRGQKYVMFKDLSEIEKQKILNRRKGKSKNVVYDQKVKIDDTEISQKEIVMEDILNAFKENNLEWPEEYESIIPLFKQLNVLLHNYIDPYFAAENLINTLETDYLHAKEHYSNLYNKCIGRVDQEELEEIKYKKHLWEDRHNALLEIRRTIKNALVEYNNGGELFTHLSKDEKFMKMFESNYNRILEVEDILKDGNYKVRASSLVENEEFCIGKKGYLHPNKNRYQVKIKTMYKGVRNEKDFIKTVSAVSAEEAIKQVTDYLDSDRDRFKFTYTKNDISVIKLIDGGYPRIY